MKGFYYGEGKYQYADGGYYVGEYKNLRGNVPGGVNLPLLDGKRHGFGRRVWSNGNQYEGQWVEERMMGQGKLTYVEGRTYEGGFLNNLRHGQGKEEFGNTIGIPFVCPLGTSHLGTG